MVRVLHVIGSLNYGGSQKLIEQIYKNINRDKVAFDFVIDHPQEIQLKAELERLGANIYIMPQFKGYNLLSYILSWHLFLSRHKYDVIHGHVRSTASIYLFIAKLHGIITISHSHSISSGKGAKAIVKNFLQFFVRFVADYYFACSYEAGKWLFGKKALTTPRFHIVNNGIDYSLFKLDLSLRDKLRSELNLTDSFVIGHVGRFHESKNHLYLLEVFKEFSDNCSNAKLLLVGGIDNKEYPKVKQFVLNNSLDEKVVFYGATNDVASLLNAMDCFLFPSKWEGFGISVLEAQANGLPCYISDRIPNEVIIGNKVTKMSISIKPSEWAQRILSDCPLDRLSCSYDVAYDIIENSKWIESFYIKIVDDLRDRRKK